MSLLPASIKRIESKTTEKRWRHHFPHYKSMGAFCCHGNQSFDPNLPQNLMKPFPHPNDATHKIWSRLANWLQRYSSSKVWNFRHSRASNCKMSGLFRPKIRSVVRSGRNSNSSEILYISSLPASIERIGSKTTEERWRHRFPYYKSMGAFCCHGNQKFDPIYPKPLCSLSPTPVMLHIKFDQDWPTGFRDIQVWKCGRRRTDDGRTTDHWYTISSPCEPSAQVS